jgi:hypothetical protein
MAFIFPIFFPSYWECHHPNWRSPSFFRGVGTPPTRSNVTSKVNSPGPVDVKPAVTVNTSDRRDPPPLPDRGWAWHRCERSKGQILVSRNEIMLVLLVNIRQTINHPYFGGLYMFIPFMGQLMNIGDGLLLLYPHDQRCPKLGPKFDPHPSGFKVNPAAAALRLCRPKVASASVDKKICRGQLGFCPWYLDRLVDFSRDCQTPI